MLRALSIYTIAHVGRDISQIHDFLRKKNIEEKIRKNPGLLANFLTHIKKKTGKYPDIPHLFSSIREALLAEENYLKTLVDEKYIETVKDNEQNLNMLSWGIIMLYIELEPFVCLHPLIYIAYDP